LSSEEHGYRSGGTAAGRIGCAVAAVAGIVFGLPLLFLATYGGGGCEGAVQPCEGEDRWFWIALAIIAVSCGGLGLLVRAVILRLRRRQ
jgi:hypothetical protein